MMPKLLQINVTANWGSTGKIAEGIGIAAQKFEWESILAYGRMMNPSKNRLIKVGNMADVLTHYALHRFWGQEGLGSKGATSSFIKIIQEERPDIVQLHNIHDHWLNYPLLFEYLASTNIHVFWTFHDCWAFTGGCPHFENIGCKKWRTDGCQGICTLGMKHTAKNFNLRKKYFGALGNRLHVVCVSDWLAQYAKKSFLEESGAEFSVINNGIDVHGVFQLKDEPKEKMILGVSNIWNNEKGLSDFIKLRNLISSDIKIVLVGLTKKQIAELPVGIVGLPRTGSAEELAKLYAKASIFVNPTYNDSFPTVNLEALACGTPVITYRTGGSPEAVDDKTGIVIEKGDVRTLATAVDNIIDSPGKYEASQCRKRAEQRFDKDIQFSKYIELYNQKIRL